MVDASVAVTPVGAPLTLRETAAFSDEPAVDVIVVCVLWPSITFKDVDEALNVKDAPALLSVQ